jgi:hypothetical protein
MKTQIASLCGNMQKRGRAARERGRADISDRTESKPRRIAGGQSADTDRHRVGAHQTELCKLNFGWRMKQKRQQTPVAAACVAEHALTFFHHLSATLAKLAVIFGKMGVAHSQLELAKHLRQSI